MPISSKPAFPTDSDPTPWHGPAEPPRPARAAPPVHVPTVAALPAGHVACERCERVVPNAQAIRLSRIEATEHRWRCGRCELVVEMGRGGIAIDL